MVKAIKLLDWFGHGWVMWRLGGRYREQTRSHRGNANLMWEQGLPAIAQAQSTLIPDQPGSLRIRLR